jgi:recombination protein RecA
VTDVDGATAATLNAFLTQMQGTGKSVFALGDDTANSDVAVIPTGAISLDVALGVGGVPRGRIIELYGSESSGKTSLTLAIAASAQRHGYNVGFIDAEHALSRDHARAYGVDIGKLAFYQPDHGQDGLEMACTMANSGAFGLVIIDSVAALTPKEELEGSMEDMQVGAQARMMSKGMRKLAGAAQSTGTCVIFINQIREKIGVMMGNPETTPGGRALKFFASVRLQVFSAAGDRITADGNKTSVPIGQVVRVKVVKNKVAPPMRRAEFTIRYDSGVDVAASILEAGKEVGLLETKGASIIDATNGERLAVGKNNFSQLLRDQPELADKLTEQIHAVLRGELQIVAVESPAA